DTNKVASATAAVKTRFMVPMHAQKRKAALHEPQRRAGILPASAGNADGTERLALTRSPGRLRACPTLGALRLVTTVRLRFLEDGRVLESGIHGSCSVGFN